MKRRVLFVGGILAIAAGLYCALGVLMTASFSATPGYDIRSAESAFRLWVAGSVFLLTLGGFLLLKARHPQR
jgi:hypothetical protein